MIKAILLRKMLVAALVLASGHPSMLFAQRDTFSLIYLGGQSNMDGYGDVEELPEPLLRKRTDTWIFTGNPAPDGDGNGGLGVWEALQPGHGVGFSSNGIVNSHSDRFGLELSFAAAWHTAFPGQKLALIKYSRGGTSIDSLAAGQFGCWEPDMRKLNGVNQYDHFLRTLTNAAGQSDINGDGRTDVLVPVGILWMQGESDAAHTEEIALQYEHNLKRLIDLMRAALHRDDLPAVIGRIAESRKNDAGKVWRYGELVQHAQEQFVMRDVKAAIVRDSETYAFSDPWHYDSKGYIRLGEAFCRQLLTLLDKK